MVEAILTAFGQFKEAILTNVNSSQITSPLKSNTNNTGAKPLSCMTLCDFVIFLGTLTDIPLKTAPLLTRLC
jgi:hypothetical protein